MKRNHVLEAAALLLILSATVNAMEPTPRYEYIETEGDRANVRIDLDWPAEYRIAPGLFGRFAENINFMVYGGVWAQLLHNPSLEPVTTARNSGQYNASDDGRLHAMTREDLITDRVPEHVGYWWFPWNESGTTLSMVGEAFNTAYAQRIERADTEPGGIRTPIYLPLHRTRGYELSLYVRGATAPIVARLVDIHDSSRVLASINWDPPEGEGWQRLDAYLTLDLPAEKDDNAAWFQLGLASPGRADFDQVMLWPDDHVEGFDPDVIERMREDRVTLVRFPGGNYVSGYNWKDDLVPLEKRPSVPNPAWDVLDPHHVGTDEWIRFCRLIGAKPMICINAGDGTAEDAADWVEYCNGSVETEWGRRRAENGFPEPYQVRIWEVGNELWGDWQIGHTTPEDYARRYRAFAEAMLERDPTIELVANGHKGDFSPGWNTPLLEANGAAVRSLSLHLLIDIWASLSPQQAYRDQMGFSHLFEKLFRDVHAEARANGSPGLIAVTEIFQIGGHRLYQPNAVSQAEACFIAASLNAMIRTEGIVEICTYTGFVNLGGLLKDQERVVRSPASYAMGYLPLLIGAQPLATRVETPFREIGLMPLAWADPADSRYPMLDALAARGEQALHVVLVHRGAEAPLEISLDALGAGDGAGEWWLLAGEHFMSRNSLIAPDRVTPQIQPVDMQKGRVHLTVPPASVSVLSFPLN